jgi:hypothetical protein
VIRPCSLRDLPAVRSLQHDGIWLDLFHHLLLQRSALSSALMAPVPWVGAGLATYVWPQTGRAQGFVQLLKRPGRYEADLLFIAPRLQGVAHGQLAWEHLLAGCIGEASEQALRRLFASAPESGRESEILASLGFLVYTNEEVYVLSGSWQPPGPPVNPRPRLRRPEDIWWLRRLYSIYTPQPVQHAEGHQNDDGQASLPLAWWEMTNQSSFVVQDRGDVVGGVQLVSGRRGHWLLLHGNPGDAGLMAALVRCGIDAAADSRWPIYCAVRDYQGGLSPVLQASGFQSFTRRSRLIKRLAVPVKAAEPLAVPGLVAEGPGS